MTSTEDTRRWPTGRVAALVGAAIVVALVVAGQYASARGIWVEQTGEIAVIAVAFTAMGVLVLVGIPGHLVGRLMLAAGGAASVAVLAESWGSWLPLAWLSQWAWWIPYGLIFLALLVFPDGRLPSRRWRPVAVVIITGTVVAALAYATAALDDPYSLVSDPEPAPTQRARTLVLVALLAIGVTLLGLIAVLVSLVLRWRRADGETRAQLACLLASAILLLLGLVLEAINLPGAWVIMVVALPIGLAVAVLRYRLYGLDQVINRTIVWLVMSLLVIAAFVGLITLLRDLLMAGSTSNASLVATGLIAVAFEPARGRVQRGVNRLLYGDRDDPYQVMARLGDLLGRTVEPGAVLPLLTDTIARSLRVPHVAVEVEGREGPRVLAAHGTANTPVESFDMVTRGERVGRLLVANRSAASRFTPVERRLLGDLAVHAAVAAEAVRLIHDLQESRERLITAREEERRRLRRDLHDGLGPTLAGMAMQVRAAHKLVAGQPRTGRILDALTADLQTCTAEVRQLVDQLRPPALDRGLAAALRNECARFDSPALAVRLHVEGNLQGLPAAIEVAAYRIVAEALNNVTRHSQASTCRVNVHRDRALTVEIVDDGVGLGPRRPGGVGLDSMRERATELGGDFDITPASPHGTSIRVRLPFQPAIPDQATGAAAQDGPATLGRAVTGAPAGDVSVADRTGDEAEPDPGSGTPDGRWGAAHRSVDAGPESEVPQPRSGAAQPAATAPPAAGSQSPDSDADRIG
ncbi:sensor histidine kinase [Plantactinospora sp. KLBMP9567]|uniref:sensor histidine kinase n=1 Tax=Plantactinospora sp. KLBMP9567 TaxID=3085900 RepID=UPI00298254CB|nr:sensor histidine kinase [Plantactinospora sp. KLBMP9567]MDW5330078.1 sensor histidine kinase [Plantactinospora sp. KLBMP9567]